MAARQRPRWSLWFWWALSSTLGVSIGVTLIPLAVDAGLFGFPVELLDNATANKYFSLAFAGVVLGSTLGFAQWLVLRRYSQQKIHWIWASAVGMVLGNIALFLFYDLLWITLRWPSPQTFFNITLAPKSLEFQMRLSLIVRLVAQTWAGVVFGLCQWLILRRSVHAAGWWILANALAWPITAYLGTTAFWAMVDASHLSRSWGWMAVGGAFLDMYMPDALPFLGVGVGMITGFTLLGLFREYSRGQS